MKRVLAILVCVLAAAPVGSAEVPATRTHQVRLNGHTFTLPTGFTIEVAAGPPLVERPIVADLDEQGRLYAADSSGSNDRVEVQLEKKPHRVVRLVDTDGDGRYDRATVFADRLMFPEGAMWLAGSLYVAGPPDIMKLTDADGVGKAGAREVWFRGKTLTGCANDLHGPYRGPDGWIYWCKGAFAKQTYQLPNGKPFVTRASHIFRCRPDGSGVEPVMTGGMDNPVDVVFTPGGERIFTTTFFQHPGGGHRDGLIHAVYGGVYGKDHDVVYEHPWTGPSLMPVLTHMGPAAPCGLTRYESDAFGKDYRDNLFACQFNLHKVSRHVLEPTGATFKSRDEDFLASDNIDFHPTDVLEDADGSLLVVDTGGWYKLCCPTSQLHKPDVLGAIYRVRRADAPKRADPRGLKLNWPKLAANELASLLDDPRPAVRRRAIETLGNRGVSAVAALGDVIKSGQSIEARRNAVWALTRIDNAEARRSAREALADAEETVRQVAGHSVSVWRDRDAVPALLKLLGGPSAQNRRIAAEALGRIGDRSAIPAILSAVAEPADRALEHSLTYALIEFGDREAVAVGLRSENVFARRAALIALDQMGARLEPRVVAAEVNSPEPRLKEAAAWIAGRHPEWGGELAGYLRERLGNRNLSATDRDELVAQLAKFARTPAVQQLLADRLSDPAAPDEVRRTVLRAMGQAGLSDTPSAWLASVTGLLAAKDPEWIREAAATARSWPQPKQRPAQLVEALLQAGGTESIPADARLAALAAVPGGLEQVSPALLGFLTAHLSTERPVPVRSLAADVLARARLSPDQLATLADSLKAAGPMELDRVLEAFTRSADERVGRTVVEALGSAPSLMNLRADSLRQRFAKYPESVRREIEKLCGRINVEEGKQRARLELMLAGLKEGDVRRGQAVFMSQKASCSSCHAIGYLGGKIGPDLTRIGQIRTERDLLESIVFPSASFVRSYEPVRVSTRDGRTINGLVKKDGAEALVLVVSATEEVRVARDDIEEVTPGKVSIMPAGLDQQLTARELADLVAFLRACR